MIRHVFPAVLFLCAIAAAQTEQPETKQDPADSKVFRIDVNLVQVDAVVTDKDGRPVDDLTANDFTILQDGKRQEITNFSLVRLKDSAVTRPVVKRPASEIQETPSRPPLQSVKLKKNEIRGVIALVVDDLGLSFSNMVRSREAIRKWVDEEMQPGDLVAVVTTGLGMGGLQQFTGDRRVLHEAIDRIHFNVLSRVGSSSFRAESGASVLSPIGGTIRSVLGTLEAIRYVLKGIGNFPGRKSLMLFSEHLRIHFDDGGIMAMDLSDLVKEKLDQLIQDANRGAVVLHTIDPRGALRTEISVEDTLTLVGGNAMSLDAMGDRTAETMAKMNEVASAREMEWIKSREGLFIMPGETGGLYIPNHNEVGIALQEAARDGEVYYLIGFRPDAETVAEMQHNRGKFHEIKVRVKRPGLEVRSRSGFFSSTDTTYAPAPPADTMAQAMLSPLMHDDLAVHLTSGYVQSTGGEYLLRAWVHLPGRQLTVLRDNNGENSISLETHAATTGFDGLIRDSDRTVHRIPLTNQGVLSVREHGLRLSITIPAKDPGAYFVRLAVKDQGSGRIGSAYQYIEIPDLKKEGLALSDLFVVNSNEDVRWILSQTGRESEDRLYSAGQNREKSPAIRQYQPGESIEYLTLIYNTDTRPDLPLDLETRTILYRDGSEIFTSEPEAVDLTGVTDLERIPVKKRLRLGKTMPPGDYILQLQVRDKRAEERDGFAVRSLDFHVIPEQEPTNLEKAEMSIRLGNEANHAGKKEEAAQAFAEAARLYREELRYSPDDIVLWKETGTVSFLAGQTDQAVAAYQEAVRLQPEDAESHYMLGIIRATNDVESAIGDFREAVRLNPENAKYHFDLGRALAQIEDFESSIEAFREASRLDPRDGESLASLGIVLEQMGETEEAAEEYRKALALNLTDRSAESVRGLLKNALEDFKNPDTIKRQEYYTLRVKQWRDAVNNHIPGESDEAAVEVGSWPVEDLRIVLYLVDHIKRGKLQSYIDAGVISLFKGRRYINQNILPFLHIPDDSNPLLKRAALLHTDIALLQLDTGQIREKRPDYRGAVSIKGNDAIALQDGHATVQGRGWHWKFARQLLDNVTPRPSEDGMVRKWYVAATAFMLAGRLAADAEDNLALAMEYFPSDPHLLFYRGVLHEKYAAPAFQNALPPDGITFAFGNAETELKKARKYFQKALKADPEFSEARLHLGRVMGLLGDHQEAVEELQKAAASITDDRLSYYGFLYLGNELAALNRTAEARIQYETAAALYPNARAPLLSLSRLALSGGDYKNALFFGKQVLTLPSEEAGSDDPWWSYDVSPGFNASALISEMYEAVEIPAP
ncbi:MAG: VWA domain-containing protein [Acidobacteria bacterium]|nr:VWA domain-containing protein [Acidobacteriota bacterium]